MTLFEYTIINRFIGTRGREIEDFEDMINELAGEGWEAVNITANTSPQERHSDGGSFLYCLLRRKRES